MFGSFQSINFSFFFFQIFKFTKEKRFLRSLERCSQAIDNATDNVTMRTVEVDNTAAASQLEGSQLTIDSHASADQTSRKENKFAQVLS